MVADEEMSRWRRKRWRKKEEEKEKDEKNPDNVNMRSEANGSILPQRNDGFRIRRVAHQRHHILSARTLEGILR